MKVLVTGANGFIGRNLCLQLKQKGEEVLEFDRDTKEPLEDLVSRADFVMHLAGVNRPLNPEEFQDGNVNLTYRLIEILKKDARHLPLLLSSSIQAERDNPYGKSKKAAEDLVFQYGNQTGAPVYVFRLDNAFGKWCRPNYNSAVATFCNAFANDLPYTVNDPSVELELLYIDDLVDEMIACLRGEEHRCEFAGLNVIPVPEGRYCYVPVMHKATLGEIVSLLKEFAAQPSTLMIPEIPAGSFAKKLYSTYLSYLPKEKAAFPLKMNVDARGSFTELVHTHGAGQVSINISKPGITKGQHWHNTKFEQFIVVKGHGLIQQRRIGSDEVIEFEVSGDNIQAVHMLPGYTHNIINLSDTEDLVTVMYCNEVFDPSKPDTYFEPVK